MAWLLALLQTLLFIASAPILAGWLKKVKCRHKTGGLLRCSSLTGI